MAWREINSLVPGYMVMCDRGGSMADMRVRLPQNTLPVMDAKGPFGNIEMGAMFTVLKVLKVREALARGDYRNPGWYEHPAGIVAREVVGASGAYDGRLPAPQQAPGRRRQRTSRR